MLKIAHLAPLGLHAPWGWAVPSLARKSVHMLLCKLLPPLTLTLTYSRLSSCVQSVSGGQPVKPHPLAGERSTEARADFTGTLSTQTSLGRSSDLPNCAPKEGDRSQGSAPVFWRTEMSTELSLCLLAMALTGCFPLASGSPPLLGAPEMEKWSHSLP